MIQRNRNAAPSIVRPLGNWSWASILVWGVVCLGLRFSVANGQDGIVKEAVELPPQTSSTPKTELDELNQLLNLDIKDLGNLSLTNGPLSAELRANEVSGAGRQVAADSTAANIISGDEAGARNTTDAGSLLGKSVRNPGVYVQQRSPILSDPRIRGYHFGQYLGSADGAAWYPARLDIDSMISKIDSKMIDDVVVINGPYSSRYGPGFAFIDIVTHHTPRFKDGVDWNGSTGLTYNGNGQQWNGSQFVQLGGEDWGASVFYGHLTGSDYRDGSGRKIPASYNSRSLNAAIGFDLSDDAAVEFKYLRQDQTDVELPGQFTDLDFLVTDGFSLNFKVKDQTWYDELNLDTWYNRTRAVGSGGRPSKQALFNSVFNKPISGLTTLPRNSYSDFDVASYGYSLALTWGEKEAKQLTLGSDLRTYKQSLNERQIRPDGPPLGPSFKRALEDVIAVLPDSQSTNPGLFAELVVPTTEQLTFRLGGRVDHVSVKAGKQNVIRRVNNAGVGAPRDFLGPDRDNEYQLWSAYLTGDYELNEVWSANAGVGFAERPPTLTELYAQRPFESLAQQGLNRIQGYPFLSPERLKQLDVGLKARTDNFHGGVRGFHAWIDDYITMQAIANDPSSSVPRLTTVFVNTPQATLTGGEAYGEWDVAPTYSLFGTIMYVEGYNQTLNQRLFDTPSLPAPPGSTQGQLIGRGIFYQGPGSEPLPQIAPLESRLGIRFHDADPPSPWEIEFSARIVDDQDQVANRSLLEQVTPGFTTFDMRGYWKPYERLAFIFGVLNLTDKHYREHLDNRAGNQLYQPGISAYVGTELTY